VVYLEWHEIAVAYKFSGLVMFPFIFCTALTKISIAFMVLRLTQTRGMKVAMYLLIVSLILVNGGCVVILFTFCRPYYAIWDINVRDAECVDARVLDWGSSVQGGECVSTCP
jgi:predicted membrane-bound dolichyl-phosphate-mannose-protein mannosyltransferase